MTVHRTGEDDTAPARPPGPHTSDRDGHAMGDQRNANETSVHRPARAATSEPRLSYDDHPLVAMLGAAVRREKLDGAAESRALVAFRVARDAGAHRARTRRRDDWRPR